MIINKIGIREQNQAVVLNAIIDNQLISRAQVSEVTNLNKASVSQITKNLIEEHFINEVGIGDSSATGGRKPIQLMFNNKCGIVASFDLGYNYLKGLLSYIDGEVILEAEKKDIFINKENAIQLIFEMLDSFLKDKPHTPYDLTGISLAIHGTVNNKNISFTPYYNLVGFDFEKSLSKKYNCPVFIDNEANLAALGEYCFSSTYNDLISFSIHSGIGVGIVSEKKLLTGAHGYAGEIGHSTLFPEGKACPCGNSGCLEQYTSTKVILDLFAEKKNIPYINLELFINAYLSGDTDAIDIARKNTLYLSIGIHNAVTFYDPEIVIINSYIYHRLPELTKLVQKNLNSRITKLVTVKNSTLANKAALFGGVARVSMNFLNIKTLKFGSE